MSGTTILKQIASKLERDCEACDHCGNCEDAGKLRAIDGSSYHFHDGFHKYQLVYGTEEATRALSVVFCRKDVLERIYEELANLVEAVTPEYKRR